jgi:hypothetical protein
MVQNQWMKQSHNFVKRVKDRIRYFGRYKKSELNLDNHLISKINHLKEFGYVILSNVVDNALFQQAQMQYKLELEEKLNFETPCLAQNKIDSVKHKVLLDNHLRYTPNQYKEQGIAFIKNEVSSYQQVLDQFRPSTLKTYIPSNNLFYKIWLHPLLLNMVEAYLGLRPYLVEAYLRRNFPADHKVMNHFWHRDTNHPDYLVKAFIFFSDCEIHHGPHEYIAGSIKDQRFKGKPYYSDDEVDSIYPPLHKHRIVSIVKAGTIILEDTRGLHRARIPASGFRDLGYAVFFPRNVFYRASKSCFTIDLATYKNLDARQQSFIVPEYITNNINND